MKFKQSEQLKWLRDFLWRISLVKFQSRVPTLHQYIFRRFAQGQCTWCWCEGFCPSGPSSKPKAHLASSVIEFLIYSRWTLGFFSTKVKMKQYQRQMALLIPDNGLLHF